MAIATSIRSVTTTSSNGSSPTPRHCKQHGSAELWVGESRRKFSSHHGLATWPEAEMEFEKKRRMVAESCRLMGLIHYSTTLARAYHRASDGPETPSRDPYREAPSPPSTRFWFRIARVPRRPNHIRY